jgi:hypothetical protein
MKPRKIESTILIILLATLCLLAFSAPAMAAFQASFLYSLSDFTGRIPYSWPRISIDRERSEIYVLYENTLRIFSDSGMEVYRFGDDLDLGQLADVTVDQNGDIFLLSYKQSVASIVRCNYRGEPQSEIALKNLPPEFSGFSPSRIIYQDGQFYLGNYSGMRIVVIDHEGIFKRGYDLIPLLELDERDRNNMELGGFGVDKEGNILFTVPVLFKACVLSPDGNITEFGRPGSLAGKFNVVAGIARDSKGNYLIADKLKCAVMVFDRNFNFITQFGYRGSKPENLFVPDEIIIDNKDRVYVTQTRRRGVSVFKLTHE